MAIFGVVVMLYLATGCGLFLVVIAQGMARDYAETADNVVAMGWCGAAYYVVLWPQVAWMVGCALRLKLRSGAAREAR